MGPASYFLPFLCAANHLGPTDEDCSGCSDAVFTVPRCTSVQASHIRELPNMGSFCLHCISLGAKSRTSWTQHNIIPQYYWHSPLIALVSEAIQPWSWGAYHFCLLLPFPVQRTLPDAIYHRKIVNNIFTKQSIGDRIELKIPHANMPCVCVCVCVCVCGNQ